MKTLMKLSNKDILKFNCEFCNQQLEYNHLENNMEMAVYECNNCPILDSFFFNGTKRIKTGYSIDRNGKLYVWINNYVKNESTIYLISNSYQRQPDLIKFPQIVNVTPDNVKEKLSTILVFS